MADVTPNREGASSLPDTTLLDVVRGRGIRWLVNRIKKAADAAWDAALEGRLRGDERAEAYETGKAHAYCDVLGDQTRLP